MLIHVAGDLQLGVTPKDVALYIKTIHFGATGYFVEYAQESFEDMTMTVCNLSIEMGARGGMIAQIKRLLFRRTFIC
jgi:3-isopropylmalate/(R)-2-methylmalate dehydratase large subunit